MAQVHRAVAKAADVRHSVALKRMLPHIASSEDMVRSFVREARLVSHLRHQNVAQTYDYGKVDDTYFIVMELITGRNLREVLRHCARTTGPMPVQIALNILNQICDALDYAHNLRNDAGEPLGIIHRDVSPSNVIVSGAGVVKLIDFGVAKHSGASMQTMSGTLKGKFAYMAPEYLVGQLDARAGLFAVGVIAHELLTNRPLFSGRDHVDTMRRMRSMRIEPPSKSNPHVPPEIDDVVMTALARDPERRWQHATALHTALTTLTRRLDLVASNAQVVQWLDWAFTHAAEAPRSHRSSEPPEVETDAETNAKTEIDARTEIDAQIGEDPSISIEPGTAHRLAANQQVPLAMRGGDPAPLINAPAGTPPYASTLRLGIAPVAAPVASPAAMVQPSERPDATVLGTSAPPARAGRLSSSPPIAPGATPMSPALMAHLNAAQALAAPAAHANAPIPHPTAPGLPTPPSGSPMYPAAPGVPANVAPFAAPQSQAPYAPPPSYDPAQFPGMQPGFAPPVPSTAAPKRSSRILAVVLIVLAAAIAVLGVYFVLPLLL